MARFDLQLRPYLRFFWRLVANYIRFFRELANILLAVHSPPHTTPVITISNRTYEPNAGFRLGCGCVVYTPFISALLAS